MNVNSIMGMSRQEQLDCINKRRAEIADAVKRGETQPSFSIGSKSYTNQEWEGLIKKVDKNIDAIQKEQEERKEELDQKLLEISDFAKGSTFKYSSLIAKMNGTYQKSFPYENLAKDGVISYNGVEFVCDAQNNAICLGDVSDKANVLTIPLSGGGNLLVNRDNIDQLSDAISMFSPEDINRIMRAIADDKKAQEAQETIEENKSAGFEEIR